MKKILLLLVLGTLPSLTYSQEITEVLTEEDTLDRKNEIWFTITPMVQAIIGAETLYQPEFGLMYKRHLKGRYWLRAGGTFSPQQDFTYQSGYDVLVNDSILINTSSRSGGYHYAGILGIEYRKSTGKLTRFIGGDLIFKHQTNTRRINEQTYRIDSIAPFPERHRYIMPIGDPEELYWERRTYMGGGFGFFAGLMYPLTERFSVSAQLYMELLLTTGEIERNDRTTGIQATQRGFTQIDFNQRLFQANILYRF
jgi:hypothetical protein